VGVQRTAVVPAIQLLVEQRDVRHTVLVRLLLAYQPAGETLERTQVMVARGDALALCPQLPHELLHPRAGNVADENEPRLARQLASVIHGLLAARDLRGE